MLPLILPYLLEIDVIEFLLKSSNNISVKNIIESTEKKSQLQLILPFALQDYKSCKELPVYQDRPPISLEKYLSCKGRVKKNFMAYKIISVNKKKKMTIVSFCTQSVNKYSEGEVLEMFKGMFHLFIIFCICFINILSTLQREIIETEMDKTVELNVINIHIILKNKKI
ncbi:hypothetical protein KUTeg_014611 [Tegillarca granosa]|uniref:Uncharacterized protein n=1 Tax=Tegillarca granosa TaxID=220873 RepID=A0ABQ9EX37_TEGGR|nr:hypothetical protein KUTeg_014611 [Tegillarca granosa]